MTTSEYVCLVDNGRDHLVSDNHSTNQYIISLCHARALLLLLPFLPHSTATVFLCFSCSRNTLVGYQASPRGGTVRVTYIPGTEKTDITNTIQQDRSLQGDEEGTGRPSGRVKLEGKAVTVFRGLFRR